MLETKTSRFNTVKYMEKKSMTTITYRNEKHQSLFEKSIEKKNPNNYPLLSALYLLTADYKLWNCTKKYISKNKIVFDNIRLSGISITGYTLFCCAKDLYCGTKHLTIADITDRNLITQKQFELIHSAMIIRRFGLEGLK